MYIKPAYIYIILLIISSTLYLKNVLWKEEKSYLKFRKYAFVVFGYGFALGLTVDQYIIEGILIPYFVLLMIVTIFIATISEKIYIKFSQK
ncbi:hypothetical protein ACFSCX_21045 [Bacillus salitolerans]|uniref:Uncharacterized protein n=1 Tax=Bacillus salitolerans TaxID=1437434 RepID=A0ABW4LV36_9BACI